MPSNYTGLELTLGAVIVLLLVLLVGNADFVDAVKRENDALHARLTQAKACDTLARRHP